MIIGVLGCVDSGKSTFVRTHINGTFKQKYGRTEQLRFIQGKIGATSVNFVDSPGHSLLGFNSSTTVGLSDAIIYMVDCNNPDVANLEKVYKKKPTIVLLNKTFEDDSTTLKQRCSTERGKTDIHMMTYNCFKRFENTSEIVFKPFLEPYDPSQNEVIVFPISLKNNVGVDQFAKYFKNYWSKFITPREGAYVYLYQQTPVRKYKVISTTPSIPDHVFYLKGSYYKFNELFSYNPVHNDYVLKKDVVNSNIYHGTITPEPVNSDINVPDLDLEYQVSATFKKNLSLKNDLKILYFTDLLNGAAPFKKLVNDDVEVQYIDKIPLKNFLALEPSPDVLKLGWAKSQHIDAKNNVHVFDSFLNLVDHFEKYVERVVNETNATQLKKLQQFAIGRLMSRFIFKHDKTTVICGAELLHGVLRKGDELIFSKDPNLRSVIQDIQLNNKSVVTWDDPSCNCALKLKILFEWVPSDPSHLKFSHKSYDQTANNGVILDQITKIKTLI